jgi:hypothetical protein
LADLQRDVQPKHSARPVNQIAGPKVEHLSGATLQRSPHLHHLPAGIDADQKTSLLQSVPQSLRAHRDTLNSG